MLILIQFILEYFKIDYTTHQVNIIILNNPQRIFTLWKVWVVNITEFVILTHSQRLIDEKIKYGDCYVWLWFLLTVESWLPAESEGVAASQNVSHVKLKACSLSLSQPERRSQQVAAWYCGAMVLWYCGSVVVHSLVYRKQSSYELSGVSKQWERWHSELPGLSNI